MVVCAVIGSFDMNPTNSSYGLFVVVQMARSSCSATCGFQQRVVWTPSVVGLVQKDVEGLLIDASLRKLNLNVSQRNKIRAVVKNVLLYNSNNKKE